MIDIDGGFIADEKSGAPSRAPVAAGVAALIAAAVIAVAPHTTQAEGEESVGYLDPAKILTACIGHTGPYVRVGIRYSREQCRAWFVADMSNAMRDAIAVTRPWSKTRTR